MRKIISIRIECKCIIEQWASAQTQELASVLFFLHGAFFFHLCALLDHCALFLLLSLIPIHISWWEVQEITKQKWNFENSYVVCVYFLANQQWVLNGIFLINDWFLMLKNATCVQLVQTFVPCASCCPNRSFIHQGTYA